jgi:cytochrome c551/c552
MKRDHNAGSAVGLLRDGVVVRSLMTLTFFFLLSACVPPTSNAVEIGDPMQGKTLLSSKGCLTCHSIWGAGGELGPDFAQVISGKNLPEILGDFWNHTPKMIDYARGEGVQWPRFNRKEMENVISYLYYLNIFDNPGDPEEGRVVFHRKACDHCHSVGPFGEGLVKPIDRFARYITPMPLAQAMWNKGDVMTAMQREQGIEMPWFEGREMADIQAFIRRYGDRGGEPTEFRQPPNPFRGEELFHEKKCDRCHSMSGKSSKKKISIRGVPSLERVAFKRTLSEISGVLWDHSYKMRAKMRSVGIRFPLLEDNEMVDLIAYLYYYPFYRQVGNADKGRKMFTQKGCVRCHNPMDVAGRLKPEGVAEVKSYYIGFATAMWNHAPTMRQMYQRQKFQWPKFYGDEMQDLVTFIFQEGAHLPEGSPKPE